MGAVDGFQRRDAGRADSVDDDDGAEQWELVNTGTCEACSFLSDLAIRQFE